MNKIFKTIGLSLMSVLAMTFAACSPEDFDGANQGGLPSVAGLTEGVDYLVSVDQSTNFVTFKLLTPGLYPIWGIDGKTTTDPGYRKFYAMEGDYSYSLKVGNANGVSDGEITGTFHIDETRYDFTPFLQKLTNGETKEWRIYASKKNHMGCGPYGNPIDWWAANANEKASNGIYDDRITFTMPTDIKSAKGEYTYSPGDDGLIFVNKGVSHYPNQDPNNDYDAVENPMTSTYGFDYNVDENVIMLTLPAGTLFPYMANDSQFDQGSTFRVTDINSKTMTLVLDLDGISWQFILINGADEASAKEFDPDMVNWADVNSPLNLGAPFNTKGEFTLWWATYGWNPTSDDDPSVLPVTSYKDGVYTITTTCGGNEAWQGQCSMICPINIEAGQYYDFSIDFNSSVEKENVTFKFAEGVKGDPNAIVEEVGSVKVKKGDNKIRFAKRVAPASFANGKLIFDFGFREAGETYKISNIIIQKHNPK